MFTSCDFLFKFKTKVRNVFASFICVCVLKRDYRIKLRLVNHAVNTTIEKHAKYWTDCVQWSSHAMRAYEEQLNVTAHAEDVMPLLPALKAAIFYQYYISTDRVFLIGFSKFKQTYPTNKVLTACYTANLYCFKDKLCYHRVRANNLEAAKKTVKQKDHACKKDASEHQLICKYGMSYQQVKHKKQLRNLLYVPSQKEYGSNLTSNRQKLSKRNRQQKIKTFRINLK